MKGFDLITPGVTRAQLEKETLRVYDICDGCRRCFNLCPSFNTLLDRVDAYESDVSKFGEADFERVANECYYCKLCYNHCPYTPPHQYEIDFPRLMAAWKREITVKKGARWRDRLLCKTDLVGRWGSRLAPLANWVLTTKWLRVLGERVAGVHRDRDVLPFRRKTLTDWWAERPRVNRPAATGRKVALFAGCMVNYQATDVGKASLQVLEKNGLDIVLPEQQCCGMPFFDLGDTDAMRRAAETNIKIFRPLLDAGYDIVSPAPSCSLMFKREYPYVLPGADSTRLAEHTFDICEYLMRLRRDGSLATDFVHKPGRVGYQVPCHLRDQNIGFKSKELMEAAGATVETVERCSAHDGSWSAKVEFFELSMKTAAKTVNQLKQAEPDIMASDCPLSALQLDQAGATGTLRNRTLHPIQIVRDAYGLPS